MKFVVACIIAGLVAIDQFTKYLAVAHLSGQSDIILWPHVFQLSYVENRGAAFGMLQNKQWFFIISTLIVFIAIYKYWSKIPNTKWGKGMKIALVLIVSGAIGNLIDRVVLGYVVDFLYFSLINFPVFNIADICVVGGVALLIPVLLFGNLELEGKGSQQ